MSYYIGVPLVLLLALIEASVLPMFRIAGLQPNPVLVLLVVWLMVRGANEAFVLVPVAGFFMGLVDDAPMGTAFLALAPIAFLHEVRGAHLAESGFVLTVAFTVLMTLSYQLVYLLVFTLQGEAGPWLPALLTIAIPVCLLNAIVLLPTYAAVTAASHDLRRALYA